MRPIHHEAGANRNKSQAVSDRAIKIARAFEKQTGCLKGLDKALKVPEKKVANREPRGRAMSRWWEWNEMRKVERIVILSLELTEASGIMDLE